jgi:undecaprenyl-diphosphatase
VFESFLAFDRAAGIWLASLLEHHWIDQVMLVASAIGAKGAVWIVLGLITWAVAPAKRMKVWRLLLALGLAGLTTDAIIKPLIGRARPFVDHVEYREIGVRPDTPSFPSGHAATAAAGALAFARIWPAAAIPAWTAAALIAVSRVALGVHFPSDVLAGFLLGALLARFVCARAPDPPLVPVAAVVRDRTAVL